MDLPSVIRRRLKELGIEQKELAAAAGITESYVSQLLRRKKAPPAPDRTDIYHKMEETLRLPRGELSRLAAIHRQAELKRKVENPPRPLYQEFRELILRKCEPEKREWFHTKFESEPFGELERLVTQKLLDVAQRVAKQELEDDEWLRRMARFTERSYEEMRVTTLEFLDTDIFTVSTESCVSFLDPLIESWGMDIETFGVEIVLNRRLTLEPLKRFEFVETKAGQSSAEPPGLGDFLEDEVLSGDVTEEEVEFLKRLRFSGRQPTALYYYREVQNLRDPHHFVPGGAEAASDAQDRRPRARGLQKPKGRKSKRAGRRGIHAI